MNRLEQAKMIKGWMTEEELKWLSDIADKCESIIEIGAYMGRSTKVLAKAKLYVIDSWDGELFTNDNDYVYNTFCDNLKEENIIILKKHSQEAYIDLQHILVDFVFIDGNHYSPIIDNDILLYKNLVKNGGIIAGHDFDNYPDVRKAVTTIFPNYKKGPGSIWYEHINNRQ